MRCPVAAGQGISLQRPSVYGLCGGAPVPFLEVRTASPTAAASSCLTIGSANAVSCAPTRELNAEWTTVFWCAKTSINKR